MGIRFFFFLSFVLLSSYILLTNPSKVLAFTCFPYNPVTSCTGQADGTPCYLYSSTYGWYCANLGNYCITDGSCNNGFIANKLNGCVNGVCSVNRGNDVAHQTCPYGCIASGSSPDYISGSASCNTYPDPRLGCDTPTVTSPDCECLDTANNCEGATYTGYTTSTDGESCVPKDDCTNGTKVCSTTAPPPSTACDNPAWQCDVGVKTACTTLGITTNNQQKRTVTCTDGTSTTEYRCNTGDCLASGTWIGQCSASGTNAYFTITGSSATTYAYYSGGSCPGSGCIWQEGSISGSFTRQVTPNASFTWFVNGQAKETTSCPPAGSDPPTRTYSGASVVSIDAEFKYADGTNYDGYGLESQSNTVPISVAENSWSDCRTPTLRTVTSLSNTNQNQDYYNYYGDNCAKLAYSTRGFHRANTGWKYTDQGCTWDQGFYAPNFHRIVSAKFPDDFQVSRSVNPATEGGAKCDGTWFGGWYVLLNYTVKPPAPLTVKMNGSTSLLVTGNNFSVTSDDTRINCHSPGGYGTASQPCRYTYFMGTSPNAINPAVNLNSTVTLTPNFPGHSETDTIYTVFNGWILCDANGANCETSIVPVGTSHNGLVSLADDRKTLTLRMSRGYTAIANFTKYIPTLDGAAIPAPQVASYCPYIETHGGGDVYAGSGITTTCRNATALVAYEVVYNDRDNDCYADTVTGPVPYCAAGATFNSFNGISCIPGALNNGRQFIKVADSRGTDCDDNDLSANTLQTVYEDIDNDCYGITNSTTQACAGAVNHLSGTTCVLGSGGTATNWAAQSGDCYNNNASAHPGQTGYFTVNRGDGSFDYNCSGAEEYEHTDTGIPYYSIWDYDHCIDVSMRGAVVKSKPGCGNPSRWGNCGWRDTDKNGYQWGYTATTDCTGSTIGIADSVTGCFGEGEYNCSQNMDHLYVWGCSYNGKASCH